MRQPNNVYVKKMNLKPFPPPEDYTLEELQERLITLKESNELPVIGKERNAAIGESLEYYLGLKKNISKRADWSNYEIKTLSNNRRKIRLFSIKWEYRSGYSARELVLDYGKEHFSKHLQKPVVRLDWKIPYTKNPINKLYYKIEGNEELGLFYKKKKLAKSSINKLKQHFSNKMKKLVLVETKNESRERKQFFTVKSAMLYENTSFEQFLFAIKNNLIEMSFALMLIEPGTENENFNNKSSTLEISSTKLNCIYNLNSKIC